MALTARTSLFDRLPLDFFRPLTGPSARLYESLLRLAYEADVEHNYARLRRETMIDFAKQVLRTEPGWAERRQEFLRDLLEEEGEEAYAEAERAEEGALQAVAVRMVNRLQRAGWFSLEYVKEVGEVVAMHPDANRIQGLLVQLGRGETPPLQGTAHQLWSLLAPDTFAERPGVALVQARINAREFLRALKNLDQNIVIAVRELQRQAERPHEVLEDAFDHYERQIASIYDRLKRHENFYRLRDDIEARLDAVEGMPLQLEAAAAWRAAQDGIDLRTGRQRVEEDIFAIRQAMAAVPYVLDSLDVRNTRYSGAARRKIGYLLHQDQSTGGRLTAVIRALARVVRQERAPTPEWDLYRARFVHPHSLASVQVARPKAVPTPVAVAARVTEEELARRVEGALFGPFSERAILAHAARLLASGQRVPIRDLPLTTEDDFLQLLFLQVYGLTFNGQYAFQTTACGGASIGAPCADPRCTRCHRETEAFRVPDGFLRRLTETRAVGR